MKTASIVGIILISIGIASLAYFASPIRLLLQSVEKQNSKPVIPILGGTSATKPLVMASEISG
jgi:hypothetical protein